MLMDREALLILNAIPGLTARRIRLLMQHFGGASRILHANRNDLSACGILPNPCMERLLTFDRDHFLQTETHLAAKQKIQIISFQDKEYPRSLSEIGDAPVVLYVKGSLDTWNELALAFVGSRRASMYGTQVAQDLAGRLSEMGFSIISGLARGIDTAAHRGCLRSGSKTYAVMGCGLNHIYPAENAKLLAEIATNGAVLSEFTMNTPPQAQNFPQRNRIISGLSLGVVVVEAGRHSGALITSRFALEQGREVFAVPGHIHDPNTCGTHRLIQQGAKLITCVEDILDEIQPVLVRHPLLMSAGKEGCPSDFRPDSLPESGDEAFVLNALRRPLGMDDLVCRIGKSSADLLRLLLALEMRHKIRRLPGMLFERI